MGDFVLIYCKEYLAANYIISGGVAAGYVYKLVNIRRHDEPFNPEEGGIFLATKTAVQYGGPKFMHEDPVTKSKRVTDLTGAVISSVEIDRWSADTGRSSNVAFQPKRFTSYERDANGDRANARFDQPDPYDGSYDPSDPQSLNRYAQNDPTNLIYRGPRPSFRL